jgi:hypothetical protein
MRKPEFGVASFSFLFYENGAVCAFESLAVIYWEIIESGRWWLSALDTKASSDSRVRRRNTSRHGSIAEFQEDIRRNAALTHG